MARIRIVDAWLRSPASGVSNQRSVMVVAEKWAEQRVLMRAFANSTDQTRPTIFLHGAQLAIGPAGVDAGGAWGIHVEPPIDGRAQELRAQLELAARRLAGSKGNPPRLVDEVSGFDGKATQHWAPGTPPDLPPQTGHPQPGSYYEPSESMHVPGASGSNYNAAADELGPGGPPPSAPPRPMPPPYSPAPVANFGVGFGPPPPAPPYQRRPTAPPPGIPHGWSSPLSSPPPVRDSQPIWPAASSRTPAAGRDPRQTARGYAVGPSAPSYNSRPQATPHDARLAGIIRKTMPPGFQLSVAEREVLNALGEQAFLTSNQIEHLTHAADAIAWMDRFMSKLTSYGLDVVVPGRPVSGLATYRLSTAPSGPRRKS